MKWFSSKEKIYSDPQMQDQNLEGKHSPWQRMKLWLGLNGCIANASMLTSADYQWSIHVILN